MSKNIPITIAKGDGIGPEIMQATLKILEAAEAPLAYQEIEIGEKVYCRGETTGIGESAWDSLRSTKIFLKAPITTPQGGGVKSLNVTIRKKLGLFANVRPCVSYYPFIFTKHPDMNLVIVRENEEGLYGGIEHQQTDEVTQCLRIITRPGCERICRYAFEYATQNNRKKVTCFTKDNIMKLTDGMFHEAFDKVAKDFPEIEKEHWIIDIGTALVADTPEKFDVIVMANLYGDIVSDVAAQITGSVGLCGSSNIGQDCSMFEAIHGSAPTIANKNVANPSGLLLGAIMMLVHIEQVEVAAKIHNAWLKTIEDGIHTSDIFTENQSKQEVSTEQFTKAVIERLGDGPAKLTPVIYETGKLAPSTIYSRPEKLTYERVLKGVDVFFYASPDALQLLVQQAQAHAGNEFVLKAITNRGVQVWPNGLPETFCSDHWRCRFKATKGTSLSIRSIVNLLGRLAEGELEIIKTENLYYFDDKPKYSLA